MDLVLPVENFALLDDNDRRFLPARVLAEREEVVASGEDRGGPAHRREVETVFHPPDESLVEGGAAARNPVEVRAADGVMPRVESRRSRGDLEHVDVEGKSVVEPEFDLF